MIRARPVRKENPVIVGLWLTYLLACTIVEPVKQLDRAAGGGRRVIAQEFRISAVSRDSDDELGRAGRNISTRICASIQTRGRSYSPGAHLTIGRLSSSICHDLRNPHGRRFMAGRRCLVDYGLSFPPR